MDKSARSDRSSRSEDERRRSLPAMAVKLSTAASRRMSNSSRGGGGAASRRNSNSSNNGKTTPAPTPAPAATEEPAAAAATTTKPAEAAAATAQTTTPTSTSTGTVSASSLSTGASNSSTGNNIKILACTANMGNAEPTASSMKCWIPEGGACSLVNPLSDDTKALLQEGTFDIIAIGMQEATWKVKKKKSNGMDDSQRGDSGMDDSMRGDGIDESQIDFDDDDFDEMHLLASVQEEKEKEAADDEEGETEEGGDSLKELPNDNSQAGESDELPARDSKRSSVTKSFLKKGTGKAVSTAKVVTDSGKSAAKKTLSGGMAAAKATVAGGKAAAKSTMAAAANPHKAVVDSSKAMASTAQKAADKARETAQKAAKMTTEALLKEPDSDYLRELIGTTVLGTENYHLLKEYQRGQMRLYLFVKQSLVPEITGLDLKAENTGIGHVLANKGGIVCTFTIRKTRITFLTAHLAAHEGDKYYEARNDNLREILRGAKVGPKHLNGLDSALMSHHMFVMGDLNYRTRLPNAADLETEEQVKQVFEIVQNKEWEKLYSYDELSAGIRNKEMLVQFETLPCKFNPTFKMLREEGFQHKAQRVPSYTDRILYTSAAGLRGKLTPLAYEPCPGFITSDHKPIRGVYSITTNGSSAGVAAAASPSSEETKEVAPQQTATTPTTKTKPVSIVFKEMKCTNLPPADVDGLADPYLMFVCDPVSLVVDNRDKKNQKTKPSFDGTKLPVTAYRKKNLNPDWPEEVRLCIPETDSSNMEGALLYVLVWDYDLDISGDDLMCSMVLNLQDLTTFEEGKEEEKLVMIDQPLLKYGMEFGRIKGMIVVRRSNKDVVVEGKGKKRGLFAKLTKKLSALNLLGKSSKK